MIISVAGNISSGKTTLAKKISSLYDFAYIPNKRNELKFLDAFFQDIPGNFFATQTSFLISKVTEIDEKRKDNNIVIDRSLLEDIQIFAQLWMENYPIDEREKNLYKNLADYLMTTIPQTDIYIYCSCERETLFKRFAQRPKRSFENKYPNHYLQQLCDKYESIIFPRNSVVVEVDTQKLDIRNDNTVVGIMSSIMDGINHLENEQLSLFNYDVGGDRERDTTNPYVKVINKPSNLFLTGDIFNIKKKRIYLAAPFTEFATKELSEANNDQIHISIQAKREYNVLPPKYQRLLNRLKRLLSCDGEFDVLLPHKDENNWGKNYISNNQIIEAMIANMKSSDLIVAIVSNSIGVHMELAMMSIQGKPMVLVVVDELTSGFYADGFKMQENVLVLHVQSMEKAYNTLNNHKVLEFIRRNLKNEKMD